MKYIGGWSVNNGSTYSDGYEYTNKREAVKSLREMALGNVYEGSSGYWYLLDDTGEEVATGKV